MKRGEVWWVDLPAPAGRRLRGALQPRCGVSCARRDYGRPVRRTIRNIPVEVILDRSDGMPACCVASLDDITTLPKVLIRQRITALSTEKIQQVDQAIRFALDLD